MAYLIFSTRQGEEIGRRPLEAETVIGRSSECAIALNDGQLSRRHCRLTRTTEGWVLSDLGSRNGTRFRGRRVSRQVLREGDMFEIGLVNVLFRAGPLTDAKQDGLSRPRRPATPAEATDTAAATEAGIRFEPPAPARPIAANAPARAAINADLDWLASNGKLRSGKL